jgi:hypothetical protein
MPTPLPDRDCLDCTPEEMALAERLGLEGHERRDRAFALASFERRSEVGPKVRLFRNNRAMLARYNRRVIDQCYEHVYCSAKDGVVVQQPEVIPPLRVDPEEDQMMLNRGSELVADHRGYRSRRVAR